jgi:hypothetical protein
MRHRIPFSVLAFAAVTLGSTLAHAATCSVSNATASASLGSYDAFSAGGLTNVPFTFTLNRPNNGTGAVDLVFVSPSNLPNYNISQAGTPVTTSSNSAPTLSLASPPSGTVSIPASAWVGNSVSVNLTASVASGLNLATGANSFTYQIRYSCQGQNGSTEATNVTSASPITAGFTVLSALQASYVGSPLDFGNNPPSGTARTGNVRVASTGPFSIAVASGSGLYAMTYPGGNAATAGQSIRYSLSFLGEAPDHATSFATVNCQSAGTTGETLPISATLEEAGTTSAGKTAAPDYSDYISVTVTPLATAGGQQSCPTLGSTR